MPKGYISLEEHKRIIAELKLAHVAVMAGEESDLQTAIEAFRKAMA